MKEHPDNKSKADNGRGDKNHGVKK